MPMFLQVYKSLNLSNVVLIEPIPLFDEVFIDEKLIFDNGLFF
jgi:hypothetical protein